MPIRPENKRLYPSRRDWRAIRREVLERARHCCEGTAMHPRCRARNHQPHPETGARVVLTIAHLDHNPGNNGAPGARPNLRALCQRCHNAWDRAHRIQTARRTLLARRIRNARAAGQRALAGVR